MHAYIKYGESNIKHFLADGGVRKPIRRSLPAARRAARVGRALRARRLVGTTGVQRTARPTGTRAFGLFAGDIENHAETRFAAHHSLVRLGGFFQRKNFVHGMDVRRRTKFERIL